LTVHASKTVGLLFDAWDDFDRVMSGLSSEAAIARHHGGSSFAWTAGHVANQVDAWINVRFQGREPHPLISADRFRIGGEGAADDWAAIQAAIAGVRATARSYLEGLSDDDLRLVIPYDGSFTNLHETGLELRFAVLRAVVHHYFHIGEIAAKRVNLGHDVGDYPGQLLSTL
jgi:hypothetical protein